MYSKLLTTLVIYGFTLLLAIPTISFGDDDASYFQSLSVEGVRDDIETNQQILNHLRVDKKSRDKSLAELQALRERLDTLRSGLGNTETDTVRQRMIDGSFQDIDRLLTQHGNTNNAAAQNPSDDTPDITEALEVIKSYEKEIEGRITSMNKKYDNFGNKADATMARAMSDRGADPGYAGSSGMWIGVDYSYTRDRFYSGHIRQLGNSIKHIRQKGSITREDLSYIDRGMEDWRQKEAELIALYEQVVSLRADRGKNRQEKRILDKEIDAVVNELYKKSPEAYSKWREDPRVRERKSKVSELETLNKQLTDELSKTNAKIAGIRDKAVFSDVGDEGRVPVPPQRDDHAASGEDVPAEQTPTEEAPLELARSTWEDDEGIHSIVKLSDGSEIRTIEKPDGSTVTVKTNADGTTIESTDYPDGTRQTVTTSTDPETGDITVSTVSPDGRTAIVVKDSNGEVIRTGEGTWSGVRFASTTTDNEGRVVEVIESPNGRTTTTVTDPEGGYGTETITASDGTLISRKDFTVTTGTDENGNSVTTKFYDGFDLGEQVVTDPEGNLVEHRDVERAPEDRGRYLYDQQRKDLGGAGWEGVPQETRDEYNRDHDRLADRRQLEEEDQRMRDSWERRQERTEEEARRRDADSTERADAEYQARTDEIDRQSEREEREVARLQEDQEYQRLTRMRDELLARQERTQEERRQELERQWEEANPQTVTEARQFEIDRLKDHVETWREHANNILDTGQVEHTDPVTGERVQRPATEQEMRDAQIRRNLINNFDQRMNIEGTNQIALLEVAKSSAGLISHPTYAHSTIPDPRNINNEYRDSYDISDLRDAGTTTGDELVNSLESQMLTQASRNARAQIDEGILVGMEEVAKGTMSLANYLNPGDPIVSYIAGVETIGPDIGKKKNRAQILVEWVVEEAIGIQVNNRLSRAIDGVGTSGNRRGGPQLPSEVDTLGRANRTNGSGMARGTDINTGRAGIGDTEVLRHSNIDTGRTGSGDTEVLSHSNTLQGGTQSSRTDFGDSPRRNIPERTPEELAQMTKDERQAYNDLRASRQAFENWQSGQSLDHLDEPARISPNPQPRLTPRELTPAKRERLLQRTDNLTRQELVDKANILEQRERARRAAQAGGTPPVTDGTGRPTDFSEGATILDNPHDTQVLTPSETLQGGGKTGGGSTEVLRPSETLQSGTQPVRTPSDPASQQPHTTPVQAETPKPIAVEEFDPTPIQVEEFVLPTPERNIHEAIEHLYPGGHGAPPINTVNRNRHERLLNGGVWEQPAAGGASFTPPNVGTIKPGDIAIRINPDSQQHIRWEEHPGGLVPNYTPPAGQYAGEAKSYIHPEHLQFLDPSLPGKPTWRNYPPGRQSPHNER